MEIGRIFRSVLSVLVLASAFLWSLLVVTPDRPAAAASASMRFVGAVNVLGALSSLTVDPTTVTIPAGGEVEFVNATGVTLTLTVGGESAQIAANESASMRFAGRADQETFSASASPLGASVVGALTASVGRVVVQAQPVQQPAVADAPAAPTAAVRSPAAQLPAKVRPDNAARPEPPADPSASAPAFVPPGGEVIPVSPGATLAGDPSSSPAEGQGPSPNGAGADDRPNDDRPNDDRPGDDRRNDDPPSSDAASAHATRPPVALRPSLPPVLPPFPGFSNPQDQIGLVVLLAATVLAGLGAAAVRTVLAYRPLVLVGAHSQAAKKARRQRRTR